MIAFVTALDLSEIDVFGFRSAARGAGDARRSPATSASSSTETAKWPPCLS
jgi:hypothetical protein